MEAEKYGNLTYRQTLSFHDEQRIALYEFIEEEYASFGVSVKGITLADVNTANGWKELWKGGRATEWDWVDLFYRYQSRGGARRLDMAVHKHNRLLGLVYGMLERNRLILKVHAMEANPEDNPILGKMLDITLFAADAYAELNSVGEIWLCEPASQAHVRLYKGKGYTPYYDHMDKCTHLARRLK